MSISYRPEPPLLKFSAAETEHVMVTRVDRNDPTEVITLAWLSPGFFDGPETATLIVSADPAGADGESPLFFLEEEACVRRVEMRRDEVVPLVIARQHLERSPAGSIEFTGLIRRSFPGAEAADGNMPVRLRIEIWPPTVQVSEWSDVLDLDTMPPEDELRIGLLSVRDVPSGEDGQPSCRLRLVAMSTGRRRHSEPPVRLRPFGDDIDAGWQDKDLEIDAGPDGSTFEIGFSRDALRHRLRQETPVETGQCDVVLHVGLRCIVIDEHGRPAPLRDEVRAVHVAASIRGALAPTLAVTLGHETHSAKLLPDEGWHATFAAPVSALWGRTDETLLTFPGGSLLRFALDEPADGLRLSLSAVLRRSETEAHHAARRDFAGKGNSVEVPLTDLLPATLFDRPGGPGTGAWTFTVEGTIEGVGPADPVRHPVALTLELALSRQTDGWAIAVACDGPAASMRIGLRDGSKAFDLRLEPTGTVPGSSRPGRNPFTLPDLRVLASPDNAAADLAALGDSIAPTALLLRSRTDAEAASFREAWLDGLAETTLALAVPASGNASGRGAWNDAGREFLESFTCTDGGPVTLVPRILAAARAGIAASLARDGKAAGPHVFVVLDIGPGRSEALVLRADLADGAIAGWEAHARFDVPVGTNATDRLIAGRVAGLLDRARTRRAITDMFEIAADLPAFSDAAGAVFLREFAVARTQYADRSGIAAETFRMKVGELRADGRTAWPAMLKRRFAPRVLPIEEHDGARLVLAGNDILLDLPPSFFAADTAVKAVVDLLGKHVPATAFTVADRLCEDVGGQARLVVNTAVMPWPHLSSALAASARGAPVEMMTDAVAKGALDLLRAPALLGTAIDCDMLGFIMMRDRRPVDILYVPGSQTPRGEATLTLSGDCHLVRAAPGLDASRLAFFAEHLPEAAGEEFRLLPWTFDTARQLLSLPKKQKVGLRWERHDEDRVVRITSPAIKGKLVLPAATVT